MLMLVGHCLQRALTHKEICAQIDFTFPETTKRKIHETLPRGTHK
jgi:hypothetical protein